MSQVRDASARRLDDTRFARWFATGFDMRTTLRCSGRLLRGTVEEERDHANEVPRPTKEPPLFGYRRWVSMLPARSVALLRPPARLPPLAPPATVTPQQSQLQAVTAICRVHNKFWLPTPTAAPPYHLLAVSCGGGDTNHPTCALTRV